MKILLLLLIIMLNTNLVAAEIKCNESGTQLELNQCAYEVFEKADKELNKVYQEVIAINKNNKLYIKHLRVSQKQWLKFLDTELKTIFSCEEENKRICFGLR